MGQRGTLEAHLLNGVKLRDTQTFGRQDPYCIFQLGTVRVRSKVAEDGGTKPKWNERINLGTVSSGGDPQLLVEVYNDCLGKDDLIGGVIITLSRVFASGFDDVRAPLRSRDGRAAGELNIILKWTPEGGAAPAGAHKPPAAGAGGWPAAAASAPGYPPPAAAAAGYPPPAAAAAGYPPPAAAAAGYPPPASAAYPTAPPAPAGYSYPPPALHGSYGAPAAAAMAGAALGAAVASAAAPAPAGFPPPMPAGYVAPPSSYPAPPAPAAYGAPAPAGYPPAYGAAPPPYGAPAGYPPPPTYAAPPPAYYPPGSSHTMTTAGMGAAAGAMMGMGMAYACHPPHAHHAPVYSHHAPHYHGKWKSGKFKRGKWKGGKWK
ncbi:hypothetical protein ABPG75_010457 [Micractinium tetrahymenae]